MGERAKIHIEQVGELHADSERELVVMVWAGGLVLLSVVAMMLEGRVRGGFDGDEVIYVPSRAVDLVLVINGR